MPSNPIRLQTLYHADKSKVEYHLLELVTWLHRFVSLVSYRDDRLKLFPVRSSTLKGSTISAGNLNNNGNTNEIALSLEDKNLLEEVVKRRNLFRGLRKSQEFVIFKNKNKVWAFSKSTGSSPRRGHKYKKGDVLDVLDGLDSTFLAPKEDLRSNNRSFN